MTSFHAALRRDSGQGDGQLSWLPWPYCGTIHYTHYTPVNFAPFIIIYFRVGVCTGIKISYENKTAVFFQETLLVKNWNSYIFYVCEKNTLDLMQRNVVCHVQQVIMEVNVKCPATVFQMKLVIILLAVYQTLSVVSLKYTYIIYYTWYILKYTDSFLLI